MPRVLVRKATSKRINYEESFEHEWKVFEVETGGGTGGVGGCRDGREFLSASHA